MSLTFVLAGCDLFNVADTPAPATIEDSARTIAVSALRIELDVQSLRVAAGQLNGKTFNDQTFEELQGYIADAAERVVAGAEQGDNDALGAASATVHFAGITYDLLRIDYEVVVRGLAQVTRGSTNEAVNRALGTLRKIRDNPLWPQQDPAEVGHELSHLLIARTSLMASLPAASVMRSGVAAASVLTGALSAAALARAAPAAVARLAAWLRGTGQPAAGLVLAGEGAAGGVVGIQAVAGSSALVLTAAELQVLVEIGVVTAAAGILFAVAEGHWHHILTNKNWKSPRTGGPWSPAFETYLNGAGLKFSNPLNRVRVKGHRGPHPEAYHRYVFDQLELATTGLKPGTPEYREAVISVLKKLGKEVQTPGTRLNQLLTGGAGG